MAHLPLLFSFSSIIFLLSLTALTTTTQTTSTVGKDQVPRILCNECELPPPPPKKRSPPPPSPPPPVVECPPPPSPPPPVVECPPPPSPPPPVVECPPPPSPQPPVVECPPPPKPPCGEGVIHCSLPPVLGTPDEPSYLLPPRTPYPPLTSDLDYIVNGAKMIRFSNPTYFSLQSFIFLILLCLPYYLFI